MYALATLFVGGAVNLFPCAAGAETAQEAKKSCHAESAHEKHQGKAKEKKEKACCTLHCYNPAYIEPLAKMLPPTTATVIIRNEEVKKISLTITPPLPPPRFI